MVANTGENVQHNVMNIENVEVRQLIENLSDPPEPRESFLRRFFMFTCAVALWCGIIVTSLVALSIITVVILAVMKAAH